ncbi:MAG: hypothetical protein IIA88_10540 [Bacteroidetes bacterium]|nr:hypothetical protein [Bacteroidota bacterium]
MKNPIIFLTALLTLSLGLGTWNLGLGTCSAQDYTFDPDKKTKTDREVYNEGKAKYSKVLLIPYRPVMHLPDPAGDVELVKHSKKNYKEIRKKLRWSLDFSLAEIIKTHYKIMPLLRNQTEGGQRDLDRIYASVGYRYEKRVIKEDATKKPTLNPKQLFTKRDKDKTQTGIVEGQIVTEEKNREKEYMNVTIKDETLIPYLSNKYGTDLFVFINQFEIKKTFASGSDVPYSNYEREVKVHYTILDKDGNQLWGDVIIAHIPPKTDDIEDIIKIAFTPIAEQLSANLPGVGKTSEEIKMEKQSKKKAEEQDLVRPR